VSVKCRMKAKAACRKFPKQTGVTNPLVCPYLTAFVADPCELLRRSEVLIVEMISFTKEMKIW